MNAITEVAAIVEVDHERAIQVAMKAWKAAHQKAMADWERASTSRDVAERKRLVVARLLVEARKQWPERGPNAKGWGEFLSKMDLAQSTASRWMAEYTKKVSLSDGNVSENSTAVVEVDPVHDDDGDDVANGPAADWQREIASRRETAPDPPTSKVVSRRAVNARATLALDELRHVAAHVHGRTGFHISVADIEARIARAIAALEELVEA